MKKVILITGASTGVGAALARQAAAAGHSVYATMRTPAKAPDFGADVTVLPLDVGDTGSVDAAVARVIADHGRIDVLVNNAGIGFVRSVEQATEAEIAGVVDTNLMGVIRCTKAVLPHMRAARSGQVITISSVGGLVGQPFNEVYCATKFGVEGLMESLATYVGPAFGLGFTLVEPGGITSEFVASIMKGMAATGGILDDAYKPLADAYLGGRGSRAQEGVYQTSDEVAAVVLGVVGMEKPPVRLRTSPWSEAFCALKTAADPDGSKQRDLVIEQLLGGLKGIR